MQCKQETWPRKNHICGVDDGNKLVYACFSPTCPFLSSVSPCSLRCFVPKHAGWKLQGPSRKHLAQNLFWPFRLQQAQKSTSRFDFRAGVEKRFYVLLEHGIYNYAYLNTIYIYIRKITKARLWIEKRAEPKGACLVSKSTTILGVYIRYFGNILFSQSNYLQHLWATVNCPTGDWLDCCDESAVVCLLFRPAFPAVNGGKLV